VREREHHAHHIHCHPVVTNPMQHCETRDYKSIPMNDDAKPTMNDDVKSNHEYPRDPPAGSSQPRAVGSSQADVVGQRPDQLQVGHKHMQGWVQSHCC
jgi:hypothetical protein